MIVRPASTGPFPSDPRLRAGAEAERQMAFYLHRAFAEDPAVHVLHDLRLVDPHQPEHTCNPGVAQIDHLLIHRLGMFIVESKAIRGVITVRPDGHGGDEWTRDREGMPSPIRQAERQSAVLRAFLQRSRESLLGKMPLGLRTVMKVVAGTDQRGFTNMPIQIIAAISDQGRIDQKGGWKPPTEPFRTFLCKADTVAVHIRSELSVHSEAAPLLAERKGAYGEWSMSAAEARSVAEFLAANHQPLHQSPAPTPRSAASTLPLQPQPPRSAAAAPQPPGGPKLPACQHCGSTALTPLWGRYGYYWKCEECSKNTAMPTVCCACGAKDDRGKVVRIRKDGPAYYRECESCGIAERLS